MLSRRCGDASTKVAERYGEHEPTGGGHFPGDDRRHDAQLGVDSVEHENGSGQRSVGGTQLHSNTTTAAPRQVF